MLIRFGNHCDDVSGFSVDLSARDDNADPAQVRCFLQFGQSAGLAPAEAWAEVAQPAKQIVGALFVRETRGVRIWDEVGGREPVGVGATAIP